MANRYNIKGVDPDGTTNEALDVDVDFLLDFWHGMADNLVQRGSVVTVEVIED